MSIERQRNAIASDFYKRWKEKLIFQKHNKIINEEIIAEWNLGAQQINHDIATTLFTESLQLKLAKQLAQKNQWLCRVWRERDISGDIQGRQCNPLIVEIYNRWRAQVDNPN